MNRDPSLRHRAERKYEPEFDRARKAPMRYENRVMNDQFAIRADRGPPAPATEYRTLCISNLNPRAPDHIVSQALYEEFATFGDFNVKVVHQGDHRIAYVNFKFAEDARAAKHSRRPGSFILFDMPVRVDSVIHQRRQNAEGFTRDVGRGGTAISPGTRRPFNREEGEFPGGPDNHKFPHHLHHIAPEDDENATRTLFVGNLDNNINDQEIREVFSRFGIVEDVDIKNPSKQGFVGNAYAFVKFINLDMAHRAKVEMSGKYIGKYQCKIGYGKVSATNCLWIGGLGPWVTQETLEQEFDRFGAIKHIEWQEGKGYCYIVFDNTDAAQAACTEMRGYPIGGNDRRLRVDFADESHLGQDFGNYVPPPPTEHPNPPRPDFPEVGRSDPVSGTGDDRVRNNSWNSGDKPIDGPAVINDYNGGGDRARTTRTSYGSDRGFTAITPNTDGNRDNGRPGSFSPPVKRRRSSQSAGNNGEGEGVTELGDVSHVDNVADLAKCLPVVWNGALVLKNSAFAARMHLLSGDVHLVDTLMRDNTTTEMPVLKITQRLRLDPPKLDEVGRRVSTSGVGGHAVLLAMPGSSETLDEAGNNVQQRPLKNLVSYLRQKEAAGVISLPPNPSKDKDNIGVLHAFPQCAFGNSFLTKRAPKIVVDDDGKVEHLVIVVVKGAALA